VLSFSIHRSTTHSIPTELSVGVALIGKEDAVPPAPQVRMLEELDSWLRGLLPKYDGMVAHCDLERVTCPGPWLTEWVRERYNDAIWKYLLWHQTRKRPVRWRL
jgi:hypothetical protein